MKLPKQAKPVIRTMSTARIEARVGQSGLREMSCNLIPNVRGKILCLAACKIL